MEECPMKMSAARRVGIKLGLVAVLAFLCADRAAPQDRNLEPTYGSAKLKAGFAPDPYQKKLDAGGEIQTKLGGVTAWVAKAPDFKLHYEAGNFPLTIHVES